MIALIRASLERLPSGKTAKQCDRNITKSCSIGSIRCKQTVRRQYLSQIKMSHFHCCNIFLGSCKTQQSNNQDQRRHLELVTFHYTYCVHQIGHCLERTSCPEVKAVYLEHEPLIGAIASSPLYWSTQWCCWWWRRLMLQKLGHRTVRLQ